MPRTLNLLCHPPGACGTADAMAEQLLVICPDLAQHIARVAEQAFRRGYQHGALRGGGLDHEIWQWRFQSTLGQPHRYLDRAVIPPGMNGWQQRGYTTSLFRLACEASNTTPLVDALVRRARPENKVIR